MTTTPTRRGYALLEMLLVMTAMVILMGLCVGLIHSLLKLDKIARAHLAEASTRDRLARQFRRDARAATRSTPAGDAAGAGDRLELNGPDGRAVVYEAQGGRVLRTEQGGEQGPRRESYAFPARGLPRFRIREEGGATFAVATFPPRSGFKAGDAGRELELEAQLGRDLRLSQPEEAVR